MLIKAKENFIINQRENLRAQLDNVVNYIEDNVVVIDDKNVIVFSNSNFKDYALEKFNLLRQEGVQERVQEGVQDGIRVRISEYGGRLNINNFTQFNLSINNVERKVMGCINEVTPEGNIAVGVEAEHSGKSRIIIFQDLKKIHNTIYEQIEVNREIQFDSIVGSSKESQKVISKAKKIARGNASILITGESGTGKELMARAIHNGSDRKRGPFIAINCAAIPENLLESELFGYIPGAFTGASKSGKIGKFELANKGTIFLDEIGDMPLHLQVKILRTLQDRVVVPVGGNKPINVDIRVISATNKNLESMVANSEFREDLYYRLNVIPLEMKPLRERLEDIPILAQYFLEKYSKYYAIEVPNISREALECIINYDWPGNIRELENALEYGVNIMQDAKVLELSHLPNRILDKNLKHKVRVQTENLNLEMAEKDIIIRALKLYGNHTDDKKKAAVALGISLATLYRKMEKYDLWHGLC